MRSIWEYQTNTRGRWDLTCALGSRIRWTIFRNNVISSGQILFFTFIGGFFLIKDINPFMRIAQPYGLYHTYCCPVVSLEILPKGKSKKNPTRTSKVSMFPYLLIQLPNLWPIAIQQPSNDVDHQPTNQGAAIQAQNSKNLLDELVIILLGGRSQI